MAVGIPRSGRYRTIDSVRTRRWRVVGVAAAGAVTLLGLVAAPAGAATDPAVMPGGYRQVNLVSDVPGLAPLTDPDLVNPWGLAVSPGSDQARGSPLWVSDNGTDKSTLYSGATARSVTKSGLVVDVTSGAPTGQVFNTDPDPSAFVVRDAMGHSAPALFLFASENGGIDGWAPTVGAVGAGPSTVTEVAVLNGANAVYKGLTEARTADGHTYLYAANFRSGRVEVYDSSFTPVALAGGLFVDPTMPTGFAPFNVQELSGQLYVTYARQDGTLHDDVRGAGRGFVDVFRNDGSFVRRLVSRGALNSPWGLALAPKGFGRYAGALLVGNFGDGRITAYDRRTGVELGQLSGPDGRPIVIGGLWGLQFGNGNAAKTGELLFSAGPEHESHGLLGKIVVD